MTAAAPQGAQQGTQQALDEGAEIILGPLFALSVPATAQLARARGVSVIAFSTDSSIAGRGVYLLSFLPESDVNRIVEYSASIGKEILCRAAARKCLWQCGGGRVQAGGRPPGRTRRRVRARYGADRAGPRANVAQALGSADALFIADDGDSVVAMADALTAAGANLKNIQLLGTGPLGQSAGVREPELAGRPLCRAGSFRLPQLFRPLPRQIWRRSGANRDAGL